MCPGTIARPMIGNRQRVAGDPQGEGRLHGVSGRAAKNSGVARGIFYGVYPKLGFMRIGN